MSYLNYLTLGLVTSAGLSSAVVGIRQLLYAQKTVKSGDTISNTTSRTPFASQYLIPANTFVAGQLYRVKAYGTYSAPLLNFGTTTYSLQFVNQTTSATVQAVTAPALNNAANVTTMPFELEADIVVQATGTSGIIRSGGRIVFNTTLGGSTVTAFVPVVATIDTTQPQWLQVTVQFSIAATTINSTLQIFYVETLQPVAASN
jgi:hypothetical protein